MIRRIPSERREVELVETKDISPSVRAFLWRDVAGRAFDFLAGQWMKFFLRDGVERDYSIASPPDGSDRFEIAVTRVVGGEGSASLFSLTVGARLVVLGPNGLFVREDRHRDLPAVYVGTGTGIAPLRAMLRDELARGETAPEVLLFGCRTEADLLYRAEMEALAREHAHFAFEPTLSRPDESWRGRRGYVQAHLAEIAARLGPAHYYVCGLTKMVEDVRATLRSKLGVDRRFIHTERYD